MIFLNLVLDNTARVAKSVEIKNEFSRLEVI